MNAPNVRTCAACGHQLFAQASQCPNCGNPCIPMAYCSCCGKMIASTASVCPSCGAPQAGVAPAPMMMQQQAAPIDPNYMEDDGISTCSRVAVSLLALFLGAFGVHRYYSGRGGLGTMHLLFTIFGIILYIIGAANWMFGLVVFGGLLLTANGIWCTVEFIMGLCGALQDGEYNYIKNW